MQGHRNQDQGLSMWLHTTKVAAQLFTAALVGLMVGGLRLRALGQ
jgi:hypothetical protein